MAEGMATTDDLAMIPSPDVAAQEVALADGTKMPLVESPATNNQQLSSLQLEVSPSSSLSRAEQLSQDIIASADKQAAELRGALSSLAATYKVIVCLTLAPKDRVSSVVQRGNLILLIHLLFHRKNSTLLLPRSAPWRNNCKRLPLNLKICANSCANAMLS